MDYKLSGYNVAPGSPDAEVRSLNCALHETGVLLQ